jgi:hypothetical protein
MFKINNATLLAALVAVILPMGSSRSLAAQSLGKQHKAGVLENGCPDLTGYFFFVTPSGTLGGTTIRQRLVGQDTEYAFTDRGADGNPEKTSTVYLADGKTHEFPTGNYLASCKNGFFTVQLSYSLLEGDEAPAAYEGKRIYSIVQESGVTYLSVEIDAAAKILAPPQSTPLQAKYFARRIGK